MVFKGVSNNITLEDFKELLDYNKITHAEAERMKQKRTGRDLPLIEYSVTTQNKPRHLFRGD